MIFWKIGCLVVTSNSVKLKSISSWPNFRAKTQENHFRFHFHFKWLPTLENRRERERERERGERKKRSRHHRHRAVRRHHRHRGWRGADITGTANVSITIAISPSFVQIWWFFSEFCLCFEEWMILYIRLVTEKIWATSRKCVFYGIFKNTTKHQKIFFETFFEMQPNT